MVEEVKEAEGAKACQAQPQFVPPDHIVLLLLKVRIVLLRRGFVVR